MRRRGHPWTERPDGWIPAFVGMTLRDYTRAMFDSYLARWQLIADGAPIVTHASHLLPVRHRGEPAMLKIATMPDERAGAAVMRWWDGAGAARVLAYDDEAVLIERAMGPLSLANMARGSEDAEATRILCAAARRLHMPRGHPPTGLIALSDWFRDLPSAAESQGGILARSWEVAHGLLADPRDPVVLHGDLHHDNLLDFGPRGWLAIDPKCLIGERGFDYANIFTNPDLADPTRPVAIRPDIFARRLEIVTEESGVDRQRLLRWILAWCGLSAAWYLSDGDPAFTDLRVAELAAAELDRLA